MAELRATKKKELTVTVGTVSTDSSVGGNSLQCWAATGKSPAPEAKLGEATGCSHRTMYPVAVRFFPTVLAGRRANKIVMGPRVTYSLVPHPAGA